MQLVIGGAFSGKRKVVKANNGTFSWVSAYEGDRVGDWEAKWENGSTLVMEGWEKWIASELQNDENNDEIRRGFKTIFKTLLKEEKNRNNRIVLIMLEVGKGIVPLHKDERRLRDLAGWIAQDAVSVSDEVDFVWNGLSKRLK
ncbi:MULTISPECIES: bifunctional adenosylcobinamide kinase/adenosylcobinamide-phosphate guanylyltransferase [Neobacillus]|uniref:Adenosylcobinamide kinase n=1 Tax=Neobacillus rhizophilus TaxID=2833579 RepID=A0A942YYL1_9BACI|nr:MULTISPECIES: bifunctional adenosylcobinamide kinase/adenosylcobinamide-phosphate guanylyltransferase [Neobacillus]MBS4215101.1 bifunctional adenosylcobinamide kinase/adenosylcobinamide-phosphate guanylyltransferase [Neobacillus rhizophilus]